MITATITNVVNINQTVRVWYRIDTDDGSLTRSMDVSPESTMDQIKAMIETDMKPFKDAESSADSLKSMIGEMI